MLVVALTGAAGRFRLRAEAALKTLPDYKAKNAFEVAQATKIYSADGKLLARLYLENREVVPISQISPDLINAIVAVEDERFYSHKGVDPLGLVRAALKTASGNRQGASTITQQYIRNTILLDERTDITYARKVREAYLAIELEKRHTKREILEMYLNTIYLGEGAYGAQAASLEYFNRPASKLTLTQAATLAGLAQSPSRLDPYNNPDGAVDSAQRSTGPDARQQLHHQGAARRGRRRPSSSSTATKCRAMASTERTTSSHTSRSFSSSSSQRAPCSRVG